MPTVMEPDVALEAGWVAAAFAAAPVTKLAGVVLQPDAEAVKSTAEVKPAGAVPVNPVAVSWVAPTLMVLGALHQEPVTILAGALNVPDKKPVVGSINEPSAYVPLPPVIAPIEHKRVTKPVTGKLMTVGGASWALPGTTNAVLASMGTNAAKLIIRDIFYPPKLQAFACLIMLKLSGNRECDAACVSRIGHEESCARWQGGLS
jgi:hypothetical protein